MSDGLKSVYLTILLHGSSLVSNTEHRVCCDGILYTTNRQIDREAWELSHPDGDLSEISVLINKLCLLTAEYIDYHFSSLWYDWAVTQTHNLPFWWRALYLSTTSRLFVLINKILSK